MVLLLLVGSQCMASLRRHTELVADVVGTQWHHWCSFTHQHTNKPSLGMARPLGHFQTVSHAILRVQFLSLSERFRVCADLSTHGA